MGLIRRRELMTESSNVTVVASGSCGSSAYWTLYSDGLLAITGSGAVTSHPWTTDYLEDIVNVTFQDDITSICNYAFDQASNLENTKLPSKLTIIGENAFSGCKKLLSVDLPSTLKTINQYAFYGSDNLVITELPDNVETIGHHAFEYAYSIALSKLPKKLKTIGWYGIRATKCTFSEIPDSFTSTGSYAFYSGLKTENLYFHSVVTLGHGTFYGCRINDIYVPWSEPESGYPSSKNPFYGLARFSGTGSTTIHYNWTPPTA